MDEMIRVRSDATMECAQCLELQRHDDDDASGWPGLGSNCVHLIRSLRAEYFYQQGKLNLKNLIKRVLANKWGNCWTLKGNHFDSTALPLILRDIHPRHLAKTLLIWRRWNKFGHYKFIAKDVPYGSINSGTGPKL